MTSPARTADGSEPDDQAAWPVGPVTFEEYLAFEEASDIRHEFVGGYAYPYPLDGPAAGGGTRAHSRIVSNIHLAVTLLLRARGTSCETHSQGFKLRTPRGDTYYPDVMTGCGTTPPDDALYLDDPCLAVEVLSPRTARTDATEKYESYVEIPTLGAYLAVETSWRAVHRHWRDPDGAWRTETITGAEAVPLPCPAGGALTLAEIYDGTNVADEAPVRARLRRVKEGEPEEYAPG